MAADVVEDERSGASVDSFLLQMGKAKAGWSGDDRLSVAGTGWRLPVADCRLGS